MTSPSDSVLCQIGTQHGLFSSDTGHLIAIEIAYAYGMEISAKKTKLMTNNTSGIDTEIKVNGQKLENNHKLQIPGLSYS